MTSYDGTLFRFPLRNEEQSVSSEICDKYYNRDEVTSLLNLLSKCGDHILLFTQFVERVSVFHLRSDATKPEMMEELFSFGKQIERVLRPLPNNHTFAVLKAASSLISYRRDCSANAKLESSMILKCDFQKHSHQLFADDSISNVSYWLVTAASGSREAFNMSLANESLLSVGGVAARLIEGGNGESFAPVSLTTTDTTANSSGIVFCFLPLPIRTCLPVHINGYFAVSSSRVHLIEETVCDKTDERAVWNKLLMEDAVKEAYVILLEDVAKLCSDERCYSVWPVYNLSSDANLISRLVDNTYKEIFDTDGPHVFSSNGTVYGIARCRLLSEDIRRSPIGLLALGVFREVKSNDFEVIDLPVDVQKTIALSSARSKLASHTVTKSDFLKDWFLPNIAKASVDPRDRLVADALYDDAVYKLLEHHQCIPVEPNGMLKVPRDLIDPRSDLSYLYTKTDECFPIIHETDRNLNVAYERLVELGMKRDDLTWEQLADRCEKVPTQSELADKRLAILVQLMDKKVRQVSSADTDHIEKIRRTKFLPVEKIPYKFPLPWRGNESEYTSCVEAYLSSERYLVCCSFPLVDEFKTFKRGSLDLKQLFGLNKKVIEPETVLKQLDHVIKLADESGKLCVEEVESSKFVWDVCDKIYGFLDDYVKKTADTQGFDVNANMNSRRSILLRNNLVMMTPQCCAKTLTVGSEALLPYLCALPDTFQRNFTSLLDTIRIKDSFDASDFLSVLCKMREGYMDVPLPAADLRIAICILNDCLPLCRESVGDVEIFLPNTEGILRPMTSLCYCNDPLLDVDDADFCHSDILPKSAARLGVKTIKHAYFEKNSIGIPFGQKEKLVNRLQRILSGYPCDKEILKEMLQNADDAGATEVHFILDCRQLPTEFIFEDSWKPLQGPALCVYNNKPFTQRDIEGIQKLGEGSKGADPTKTGQFGVGFNCVYHLTDVPTLFTHVDGQEVLCIFDPNCRFAPGATPDSPGRMINLTSKFKEKYKDVFKGFFEDEYGCKDGTLFRLPLRNEEMSQQSEISQKLVSVGDIKELFDKIQGDHERLHAFLELC
jgi:sacsin